MPGPPVGEDFANTATSASYSMPPQCQGWLKRCFIAPAKSGGRSCSLSFNFVSCRMKKTRQKQNDVYVTSAHFSLLSKRCFLVLAFLFCVSPSRKGTPKNFISWLQELLAEGSVECVLYGGTSVLLPPSVSVPVQSCTCASLPASWFYTLSLCCATDHVQSSLNVQQRVPANARAPRLMLTKLRAVPIPSFCTRQSRRQSCHPFMCESFRSK